jgi:hypothetical protein
MTPTALNPEKLFRDLHNLHLRRSLLDQAIQSLERVQELQQTRLTHAPCRPSNRKDYWATNKHE